MIHLLIFQDGSSKTIELIENFYSLGRSPHRDIQIVSKSAPRSISRYHAHLVKVADDVYNIEDGDPEGVRSKSGIFIKSGEGQWIKRYSATLRDRDCIMFPPDVIIQYSTCSAEIDSEHGTVY